MGVHGGKFSAVNGISTLRSWNVNDSETQPTAVASNTCNGTSRRRGVGSWNGGLNCFGGVPSVMPGSLFDFIGYEAPDDNTLGGDGERCTGVALADSLTVNWSWGDMQIINHAVAFVGHLGLVWSNDGAIFDLSEPTLPETCGLRFDYSFDGEEWAEIENLVSATLTITAKNNAYVNSSTNCGTGRDSGPIDFTLALNQQEVKRSDYDFQIGDDLWIRGYIDPSNYWELVYSKVGEFTGLQVDRESAAIIARTINLGMNGYTLAGQRGHITLPGAGAPWWPAVECSSSGA